MEDILRLSALCILALVITFCWLVNNALKSSNKFKKSQQQIDRLSDQIEQLTQEIQQLKNNIAHSHNYNTEQLQDTTEQIAEEPLPEKQLTKEQLTEKQLIKEQVTEDNQQIVITEENRKQSPLNKRLKAKKQAKKKQQTIKETTPNALENAFYKAKKFLTTGNLPVKVGMIAIFASVIAFLKYISTIINIPIEVKLITIVALSLLALAFAWSKRMVKPRFSLVVQGGSIGIMLIVIFSAVRMYALMSPEFGFVISVALLVLTALLALKQDAHILGLTATFAGFLAPIWLSNGSGNHLVLFTYYALLNVGILVMTRYKPWYEMSILGFVATYVVGSIWGGLKYQPQHFNTVEPFIILFFLFYLYIPLHHSLGAEKAENTNHKEKQTFYNRYRLRSMVIFGTPTVTFFAHSQILTSDTQLAISCVITGLIYGALAWWLRSSNSTMMISLQRSYAGIAVTLLTLAVPIGLSAKATTTIYALEGSAGVWLGIRAYHDERSTLTWTGGILLQLLAVGGFLSVYGKANAIDPSATMIINEMYLSGLVLVISFVLSCWFCYRTVLLTPKTADELYNPEVALATLSTDHVLLVSARLLFISAMLCWLGINLYEIGRIVYNKDFMPTYMTLIMLTCAVLPIVYHHKYGYKDDLVWQTSLLLIASGALFILWQFFLSVNPPRLDIWLVYSIVGLWLWRGYRNVASQRINTTVIIWLVSLMTAFTIIIFDNLDNYITEHSVWTLVITCSLWIALLLVDIIKPQALLTLVQGQHNQLNKAKRHWQKVVSYLAMIIISVQLIALLFAEGDHSGGIWLPIINSIDIVQIGFCVLLCLWLRGNIALGGKRTGLIQSKPVLIVVAIIVISLVNVIILRFVYHNYPLLTNNQDIAWGLHMFGKGIVQMSLTFVWSVLGVIAWIIGSKYLSKAIWLVGAVLMVIVLIKLMLIDRTHLGNLFGIGSFFAYGLLCVVVGYFAPIPQSDEDKDNGE